MRTLITSVLLLPFTPLAAQVPDSLALRLHSFYSNIREGEPTPENSSFFADLKQRMDGEPTLEKAPHPLEEYKLVWAEARDGHAYNLLRGDGRTLADFLASDHAPRPHFFMMGPAFFGERFATVGDSPPTGLIRYEFWYFEREVPIRIE